MSHTLRMETLDTTQAITKEEVRLSGKEAEVYRAYKRQQRLAELTGALARSVTPISLKDDIKRLTERAARFRQAAVKVAPVAFLQVKGALAKSKVKLDCIVGGNGETATRVKAYEAKLAKKLGAKEVTLVLSPSAVFTNRYTEIRREIARVKRAAKGATLKVWVDNKYPFPMLARLARLVSEMGAAYFCVPYFSGCERLRYDLFRPCGLEVENVEALEDFRKMAGAGVERIVTSRVSELRAEWLEEIEGSEISV